MSSSLESKSPDASADSHASQDYTIEDDIQTLNNRMNKLEAKMDRGFEMMMTVMVSKLSELERRLLPTKETKVVGAEEKKTPTLEETVDTKDVISVSGSVTAMVALPDNDHGLAVKQMSPVAPMLGRRQYYTQIFQDSRRRPMKEP